MFIIHSYTMVLSSGFEIIDIIAHWIRRLFIVSLLSRSLLLLLLFDLSLLSSATSHPTITILAGTVEVWWYYINQTTIIIIRSIYITTINFYVYRSILNSCSGVLENGKVCGIVGPSGAGKTSFLSTLADRNPKMFPSIVQLIIPSIAQQ